MITEISSPILYYLVKVIFAAIAFRLSDLSFKTEREHSEWTKSQL